MIERITIGPLRPMTDQHLNNPRMGSGAADFCGGQLRVLRRHHQRTPEARILGQPVIDHIIIIGFAQGIGRIGICQGRGLNWLIPGQNRNVDIKFIEIFSFMIR